MCFAAYLLVPGIDPSNVGVGTLGYEDPSNHDGLPTSGPPEEA
jgi:hypothetical protein